MNTIIVIYVIVVIVSMLAHWHSIKLTATSFNFEGTHTLVWRILLMCDVSWKQVEILDSKVFKSFDRNCHYHFFFTFLYVSNTSGMNPSAMLRTDMFSLMCVAAQLCVLLQRISLPPLTNGVLWPHLYILLLEPRHTWVRADFRRESWDVAMEGGGQRGRLTRWPPFPLWNIAQVQKHISASWHDTTTQLNPLSPASHCPPLWPVCCVCVCVCVYAWVGVMPSTVVSPGKSA